MTAIDKNTNFRYIVSQEILRYAYESAKERMEVHPEVADKHKKAIEKIPYFKTEKEALLSALGLMDSDCTEYQIWAKVEKDEEFYYAGEQWIVTDDNMVKMSAEYIGYALMYDSSKLSKIFYNET